VKNVVFGATEPAPRCCFTKRPLHRTFSHDWALPLCEKVDIYTGIPTGCPFVKSETCLDKTIFTFAEFTGYYQVRFIFRVLHSKLMW